MTGRIENGSEERAVFDLLVTVVRTRFLLVLGVSTAFGIAMWVLASSMTPIYRGTTILAPADLGKKSMSSGLSSALGSAGGFAALAGLGLGGSDYATEEAMAVLKSQQLTETFIRDNNLMPELFPKLWDTGAGHWKSGIKKIPTLGQGFHAFDRVRKIQRDMKSGLIAVQIEWKDPLKAANWTNQLVALLNAEMRSRALTQADASLGYLQKELSGTADVGTQEAISRLIEGQIKQEMLAHVTDEYALQVVDKAIPADADAPVRPVKILYLAFGLFLGGIVGLMLALQLTKRKFSAEK